MQLHISIPKIHCARTTAELFPDAIFFSIVVLAGKLEGKSFQPSSKTPIFTALSEVRTRTRRDDAWRPEVNDFKIEVDDEVEQVAVAICLYERDKGGIYEALQEQLDLLQKPEQLDWLELLGIVKDSLVYDINKNGQTDFEDIWHALSQRPALGPAVIGSMLFRLAKKAIKHLQQDDLLGTVSDSFVFRQEGFDLPREYSFRRHRGLYKVALQVQGIPQPPSTTGLA